MPDTPQSRNLGLLKALASDLDAAGYTVDGVAALLGAEPYAALNRDQLVPARLAVRQLLEAADPRPLAAVVQLWLLGGDLTGDKVAAAFPETGAEGLAALGLVEHDAGRFRAVVDLRPHAADDAGNGADGTAATAGTGDLWVASDLGAHHRAGVLPRDHVLGIGQASLTLAQITVRPQVDRALDLGTGCGIQTFHLLRHARHVTATDISARALAFTRFNLLLNAPALGIDPERLQERVSLRLGSLLEPVAGETFDLVVSNPPFVITPRVPGETAEDQFTYRDAGLPGDQLVSLLVAGIPALLRPGGQAVMLGNWEIPAGTASWQERLESWLPDDAEAWVIQREQLTPAHYAETWLRDASENRDRLRFEQSYAAYLADFASRNVETVGFGMILLRKAADGQAGLLRRFEEITYPIEQPIGPHLAAAVARFDWLAAHRDDFADQHLVVAEDVTEERHQRPGAEHPGVILLRQGAGLRRTNLMSSELAGFVSASDGDLSAGQIISALAALLDRDDEEFRVRLAAEVRNLVLDGFLLPAAAAGASASTTD